MNTKKNSKILALLLALAMVFVMSVPAFASTENPTVTVSVVTDNFNLDGSYKGTTANPYEFGNELEITNYEVSIAEVTSNDFKSMYMPADATDPLNGAPSVIDAIITALFNNDVDFEYGWDPTNIPDLGYYPGAYISNIANDVLVSAGNNTTYFTGENGHVWGRSTGSGWNIAYGTPNNMVKADTYASRIAITDGMHIIIDRSAYDMVWDTEAY